MLRQRRAHRGRARCAQRRRRDRLRQIGAGAAHLARLEQSNDARRLWRYFKPECAPSPYYADVQIDHARLQQLPRDRAELPGLGVIETEDKAEECDLDAVASDLILCLGNSSADRASTT